MGSRHDLGYWRNQPNNPADGPGQPVTDDATDV